MLIPPTVVAETAYVLQRFGGGRAERAFIGALAHGDFAGTDVLLADYVRVEQLIGQYIDLGLGTTDATVVATKERLGVAEVATLDRRHFTAVRPRHVEAFTLLPETLEAA
jgi:uncharacterized protein